MLKYTLALYYMVKQTRKTTAKTKDQQAPSQPGAFIRKNLVMCIALIAALLSIIFVPPSKDYFSYFDYRTLTCLFCVLAVVCALKNANFFYLVSRKIIHYFKTTRYSILALVYITFIGSMLIANDMALLTFLPLGYYVLSATHHRKYIPFTFIMQTIAANLGGMLTPFGNPQNLYLFSKFNIPTDEFIHIMLPPFLLAITLITACCCIFIPSQKIDLPDKPLKIQTVKITLLLLLFAYSVLIVFRGVPFWTGLIVVPLGILLLDRKAFTQIDYPLLLTFVFFFIFAGNISRIPAINHFISALLSKDVLLVSVLSCQFISNVPSAILLSQFTANYPALLIGVNIGGTGTLISSLASLITYREYALHYPKKRGRYLALFSLINFSFLAAMTAFAKFVLGY